MGYVLGLHRNDVCAPWRILTPLAALARRGYPVRTGLIDQDWALADVDLLILHSPGSRQSASLAARACAEGIPVVADFDDAFVRYDHAAVEDVNARFRTLLATVDVVTVSTDLLAESYAQFSDNVRVLPNCFDETMVAWGLNGVPHPRLQIGFSGSGFHENNLRLVAEPLECVLRMHPDVRAVEAGGPNLLSQLDARPEQLVYLGWHAFDGFPLLLHQMDVVLAPLEDVPFNRGKSNVRCMTAGLVGAPVVASPVGAYAEYVEHGINGFHARTEADWFGALERLVTNPDLRHRMGQANRERAQAYAIGTQLWRWRAIYDPLIERRKGRK
jgi:glycosyltransferase involved in cell wall biosynthesis